MLAYFLKTNLITDFKCCCSILTPSHSTYYVRAGQFNHNKTFLYDVKATRFSHNIYTIISIQ